MKCKSVNEKGRFEIKGHGENSITYQLFNVLDRKSLFLLLDSNTDWIEKPSIEKKEDIEEVHLFPSFGRRDGWGEPDAIILAHKVIVYVEVERDNLDCKHVLKEQFIAQIQRFADLGNEISKSHRMSLRDNKKFEGGPRTNERKRKFYGPQRLRSLYKKIKKKNREPFLLVISDSNGYSVDATHLKERMKRRAKALSDKELREGWNLNGISLGWISFKKIKKMQSIKCNDDGQTIVKTINKNLAK